MESLINALHVLMPLFHSLLGLGLVLKILLMRGFRSFDLAYLFTSYFRFYENSHRQMASNNWRKWYVQLNNYINYYTYIWLFLCIINLVAYGNLG